MYRTDCHHQLLELKIKSSHTENKGFNTCWRCFQIICRAATPWCSLPIGNLVDLIYVHFCVHDSVTALASPIVKCVSFVVVNANGMSDFMSKELIFTPHNFFLNYYWFQQILESIAQLMYIIVIY